MKKIAISFVILALAIAIFTAGAYATTTPAGKVTISGFAPTIADVMVWNEHGADANITMETGQTGAVVTANATVTDYDGGADITGASATLYLTGSDSESDNANNHTSDSDCVITNGTGDYNKTVTCSFTIGYMAMPGTWTANITATDGTHSASDATANRDVSILLAFDVLDSTIEFGDMAPGTNSTDPANVTIQNLGNLVLGTTYKGDDYTCDVGSIDVNNTRYSANTGNYDSMSSNVLNATATKDTGFSLAVSSGTNITDQEFFTILTPSSGAVGACNNTVTIAATA